MLWGFRLRLWSTSCMTPAPRGAIPLSVLIFLACSLARGTESTRRLYDGVTAFVHNPEGRGFAVSLDVRDLNHRLHGPNELLVKVYGPDGRPVVREVIPDDGVLAHRSGPLAAG